MFKQVLNLYKYMPANTALNINTICKSELIIPAVLTRSMHITSQVYKSADRRDLRTYRLQAVPKDDGTQGEQSADIDTMNEKTEELFPDVNTPNKLFNGIPYKELPIFNVKATKNNTIISLTDYKGAVHILRSCGIEGFKHARKGTNVAAQATGISICTKALALGVTVVRVRVQGLGPGRVAAVKGIQIGGAKIVSITDNTHVSWSPPRPRKARRV